MDDFTPISQDNISYTPTEEEEMLSRYHMQNTIYLYGVFERDTAFNIVSINNIKFPLTLYESPMTARKLTKHTNFKNPTILRFVVDTPITQYTYDEFIEESKKLQEKSKENKKDYLNKCYYTRTYDSKNKVIVYTIRNKSPLINVQFV